MSAILHTLVACDDCQRGFRYRELIEWADPPLLLCVECAAKREEMGDA